jgi:hypothetical protein
VNPAVNIRWELGLGEKSVPLINNVPTENHNTSFTVNYRMLL